MKKILFFIILFLIATPGYTSGCDNRNHKNDEYAGDWLKKCFSKCRSRVGDSKASEPMQGQYRWSLGLDGRMFWARATDADWDQIYADYKYGFAVYLANRFTNTWGFELGFSSFDRDPQDFTVGTGTQMFGATAANTITHTAKVRVLDTYFDIYAHLRISKYAELMGGPGIGFVKQKYTFFHAPSVPADPVEAVLNGIQGKTSITARANLGIQVLWTQRIGMRALFNFETMNNVRVDNVPNSRKPLHNSYGFSFGVFWNFSGHG